MYLCIDSPAFERMEPVWAMPDKPPKESNWIVTIYLIYSAISIVEKCCIPLVISIFPINADSGSKGCIEKLAIVVVIIFVKIEKSTI